MARLTIKAASGSVEDYRVDAQPGWTIRELKNYLYRHYPSHPPITSQKLIHSGRLLLDHETVREIVPLSVDGPVVIHLVAYERSASAPAIVVPQHLQRGNRQPSLDHAEEISPSPPQPAPAHASQGTPQASQGSMQATQGRQGSMQAAQARQGSMHASQRPLQQASQGSAQVNQGSMQVPPWLRYRGPPQGYQHQMPVQNLPVGGVPAYQFYMSPYGAAYATQMAQWYSNYYRQAVPADGPVGVDGEEDLGDHQILADRQQQNDQEIEDDVPMNAGGFGMMDAGGFRRHRDLVDYLYMFMMAGFLALVAYLTGSMGRLMIFAAGVIFMLLNQAGWFSIQRRRQVRQVPQEQRQPAEERRQPGEERGQPAEEQRQPGEERRQPVEERRQPAEERGQPAEERRQPVDQQREEGAHVGQQREEGAHVGQQREEGAHVGEQRVGSDGTDDASDGQVPEPIPPPEPPRPGFMATVFVFVTAFFTSLIPQQRPELQMN